MPPLHPPSSASPPPVASAAASAVPKSPAAASGVRQRRRSASGSAPSPSVVTAAGGGGSAAPNPPSSPAAAALPWRDRKRKQIARLGEALLSPEGPSRAIAPLAIIGGTFSVYSSAIKLSTSDVNNPNAEEFTPLSMIYLVLLALNYAIMPRLSKRCIHPETNKRSVALAEEVVKMSLGMGGWVLSGYASASRANGAQNNMEDQITTASVLLEQLKDWSPYSMIVAAGLPSALYALQGTLTYVSYQNLDAVTFNGLTQLKVLSSALCCYLILGKRQSAVQVMSLGLLMASAAVFQGSWRDWFGGTNKRDNFVASDDGGNDGGNRLLLGVLPCLSATLLSGLAGAFSQRSLQTRVGSMRRDACFYTVEISFLSAACLVLSMGVERWRDGQAARTVEARNHERANGSRSESARFFRHWTRATLLPVATKATAGLLTALVHRHLGSVIKGFALVLGLVFSALLQFALEGEDLTAGQLAGTALVLLSSWLHFTNPVR